MSDPIQAGKYRHFKGPSSRRGWTRCAGWRMSTRDDHELRSCGARPVMLSKSISKMSGSRNGKSLSETDGHHLSWSICLVVLVRVQNSVYDSLVHQPESVLLLSGPSPANRFAPRSCGSLGAASLLRESGILGRVRCMRLTF